MKISHLAACIVATTIGAVPLAYSMPGGGTQVMQYRMTSDYAYGSYYDDGSGSSTGFTAQSWDDSNGVMQGWVSAYKYDNNTYQYSYINCIGPEYAGAVSVNSKGNTTIKAMLDPSEPECDNSDNVLDPVEVNLSGQADGNYHNSSQGVGTQRYPGVTYKYNSKSDDYSETFIGSNGFYDGTFSGGASASRNNIRQKVK